MKQFTLQDVKDHGAVAGAGSINAEADDLVLCLIPWQKRGLQQTASGYGAKLTSSWKINFEGKLRRLYVSCFGNSGSTWFVHKGRKIFVG